MFLVFSMFCGSKRVETCVKSRSRFRKVVLGGLTIHLPVANFLSFISAKNYENWLRADKVIAMKTVCSFFGPPCMYRNYPENLGGLGKIWGGAVPPWPLPRTATENWQIFVTMVTGSV